MEKRELTDTLYRELVVLERVMQEPSIIIDDKTGKVEQIDKTTQKPKHYAKQEEISGCTSRL